MSVFKIFKASLSSSTSVWWGAGPQALILGGKRMMISCLRGKLWVWWGKRRVNMREIQREGGGDGGRRWWREERSELLSSLHLDFKGDTDAALIPSAPPVWRGRGGGRKVNRWRPPVSTYWFLMCAYIVLYISEQYWLIYTDDLNRPEITETMNTINKQLHGSRTCCENQCKIKNK